MIISRTPIKTSPPLEQLQCPPATTSVTIAWLPGYLCSVLVLGLVLEHNLCSTVSTHSLYLFPADRTEERCLNTDMMDGM